MEDKKVKLKEALSTVLDLAVCSALDEVDADSPMLKKQYENQQEALQVVTDEWCRLEGINA